MIRVFCECNSTPNCFQDSASGLHCGSCLCCRFTGDHPVIGKPPHFIPSPPHLPIKRRQKYVAERGRNHSPLRSPALGRKEPPFSVASCLEHCLDQAQHPAVCYSLGYQREEFLVIYGSEKISEIRIHDPLRPALYLLPNFAHGVLR